MTTSANMIIFLNIVFRKKGIGGKEERRQRKEREEENKENNS